MEVCKITTEKLGCAYFFMAPALVYGIFTSRLPALEKSIGMTDKGAGALLLALGVATVIGLALCSLLIDRLGAKRTTGISAIFMMATIILAAAANSLWLMAVLCFATGICVGFCDVAMNAQGIYMETCHKTFCLSFLHGCSSLGGVIGSLTGSLFAALELSPFLNLLVVLGIYFCFWPIAFANMTNFSDKNVGGERKTNWRSVAFAVYLCGILSLVCHVAEGSTAEWGSLLLYDAKGATQSEAALVFAAYTGAMVVCRFLGDSLRHAISDIVLLFWGSLLGAGGMTLVLLANWPVLCLVGYAIMGAGLAPITPILFSLAGKSPRISPGQASGIVSTFAYAGLLLIPPFIGMFGNYAGLQNALWVIVAFCLLLAIGSLWLRKAISIP